MNDFNTLRCSTKTHFFIEGNPAHGMGPSIAIRIGNAAIGTLQTNNFSELCRIINANTITAAYPNGTSRDNHNGTHSARQARMLEVLLSVMEKGDAKDILKAFSDEEIMHLKLAAYLLRAGRIDESYHLDPSPDDYYTRSSLIYEAYATQLQVSDKTKAWIKQLIVNSCKPKGIRESIIDLDPKNKFAHDCLSVVHELDLIRCYDKYRIDTWNKKSIREVLSFYFPIEKVDRIVELLFDFSKQLCQVTGCYRTYDYHSGDTYIFSDCSNDAEKCWERVSKTRFNGDKIL